MRRFFAPGTPKPKGSLRHVGHGRLIEQVRGSASWRDAVTIAAAQARDYHGWDKWEDCPLGARLDFIVPKPASVRREWPHKRSSGDLDKLVRNALDALVDSGVIGDDSQVVELSATKGYPLTTAGIGLHVALWLIADDEEVA